MSARKVRDFATLYGANASHEGAQPLKDLIGQEIICHDADFGRSQYGKVSFMQIGETAESATWHYTTSKVILSQLEEILGQKPCPFKATLKERNGYLLLE